MGLGQTILTICAMTLLGMLFLTNNSNTLDQRSMIEQTEWEIMATSLAVSTVERATGLAFDENTITSDISSTASLSSTLGREGSTEIDSVETTFDDFDDYNGYHKIVKGDSISFRSATYKIWSAVEYVTITSDSVVTSAARTYNKRLTVYVSSPMLKDTITYSSVYSYWYFR